MKNKALHIVSAVSFITIAQLLFFWLIPTEAESFAAVYPFYTALTVAHTVLFAFICTKYEYPACFAPALSGSIVTLSEIVAGLLLGIFCETNRTIIFVQAIIIIVYVLVMALFCSIASREAVENTAPVKPVRPYAANSEPPAPVVDAPRRRMPRPAANNTNR